MLATRSCFAMLVIPAPDTFICPSRLLSKNNCCIYTVWVAFENLIKYTMMKQYSTMYLQDSKPFLQANLALIGPSCCGLCCPLFFSFALYLFLGGSGEALPRIVEETGFKRCMRKLTSSFNIKKKSIITVIRMAHMTSLSFKNRDGIV